MRGCSTTTHHNNSTMNIKRSILTLLIVMATAVASTGCGPFNKLLKSGDNDKIYAEGKNYLDQGKYPRAIMCFEQVQPYFAGTMREDSLAYYTAYAHFKSDDFSSSSEMLDEFRRKYTRSPFLEDVEGMYALSFYYLSPEPMRDQTTTTQALTAIQEFLGRYPNSTRRAAFEQMISELTQKQYDKAFINAKTYYTIGRYKSAVPALKNALKKYPDSPHREELMYLIVKSSYELAKNSIESLQRDRYMSMMDSYYSFVAEFPDSKHVKELTRMQQEAKKFIAKFGDQNEQNSAEITEN